MAPTTGAWTLADLDRFPDDGNKYEVVDGELFVTPAPSIAHEALTYELRIIIEPYVRSQRLGKTYTPRAVVRTRDSEVEPDLMVRPATAALPKTWAEMPIPLLVVEVLSRTTRRRDRVHKREFYLNNGVAEYWIVDGEQRTIRIVRPAVDDVVADVELTWQPTGAEKALIIDVKEYFREALR